MRAVRFPGFGEVPEIVVMPQPDVSEHGVIIWAAAGISDSEISGFSTLKAEPF